MKRIISTIAASGLLMGVMLVMPISAFAGNRLWCVKSWTWDNKCNTCVSTNSSVNVYMSNNADVTNTVVSEANTGGNESEKNVWGSNKVISGDAASIVWIQNNVNQNTLTIH
jgi:hypothetical protein